MNSPSLITAARRAFHASLRQSGLLGTEKGVPTIADKHSKSSIAIASQILMSLRADGNKERLNAQGSGARFEMYIAEYLSSVFRHLHELRPGNFEILKGTNRLSIAGCEQYDHLSIIEEAIRRAPELATAIGQDYIIKPDVMVVRFPETDAAINSGQHIVDNESACYASIRLKNNTLPILHASVSCKWTIRSDRAQNARSEALNLVRNRKGRLPHVVIVTAEPLPGRIASLALGTGDIDCVYHVALHELIDAVNSLEYDDSRELLTTLVSGKRLRDISDLPLDLTT